MKSDKPSEPGRKAMINQQNAPVHGSKADASPPGGLEPELQDHIGIQLRAVYNEILSEPVPDRFLKLLEELESKQADKS